MSADNNPFIQREIQALQNEAPRPDAKAELILALAKERRESKMSILRKATLPTLVSIAAIAGVFYVSQPKVMAATPEKVIKAIQDLKNYTIKSYVINGNDRHLQSKTTVNGKDRQAVYYDAHGKETTSNANAKVFVGDTAVNMGFITDDHGGLKSMSKEELDSMKGKFKITLDGRGDGKGEVRVEVRKSPDGKEEKHYFVNGKEVDKLPEGMNGKFEVLHDGPIGNGKGHEVRVEVKKGPDGQEEKHYFVNGKEVDKLPDGVDAHVKVLHDEGSLGAIGGDKKEVRVEMKKGADGKEEKYYFVNGKEVDKLPAELNDKVHIVTSDKVMQGGNVVVINNGSKAKGDQVNFTKSMALVNGKDGKPMMVQSGNTSADYLISLLKDTSKWTIERGVTYSGQKLDKFTLKGPVSPIVLYVDPSTALPKILRFETPFQKDAIIEDVYEYGIRP